MANIFPIDFEEKLTMAQDDYILFSDSEDGNKIKKAQYKNLKGEKGDTGTAATITVGSTTTGAAGSSASVTNSGTSSAAVLDFTIPKGDKGDTGQTGPAIVSAAFNGNDIDFTEEDGNVVTLTDAKIDLKGDKGDAATVSVGTTSTLPAGSSATVTNSGTSSAAVFNFGIPKGDKGDTGNTGATGNGIASITSSKVGKITTVTITETNSTVDTFQISDGADGQGSGDVLGPNSSTDGDLVGFDGATGKLIKDLGINVSDLNVKTFKLSSTSDLTTAQAAADYLAAGNNPLIIYNNRLYAVQSVQSVQIRFTGIGYSKTDASVTYLGNDSINFIMSSGTVTQVNTGSESPASVLRTGYNYPTPYSPEYNGSPATKKYVDDAVSTLMGLGKFLSLWDATTGQPISFPLETPYAYSTGDYFLVETISSATPPVNYKPTGSSYIGTASSTAETEELAVGDIYIYDGTTWLLQLNHGKAVSFSEIAGQPTDNSNLATALGDKQDTLVSGTNIKTINGESVLGSGNISISYTAGNGIDIKNDKIGLNGTYSAVESDMQGPAPDGFHVPLNTERQAVRDIRTALGGGSSDGTNFGIALKLPFAGVRISSSAGVNNQGTYGTYWSSSRYNANNAYYLRFRSTALSPQDFDSRAYGYSVRCFKNSPTVPTSSWTKLYGTSIESGGIFRSSTDGLISLSSDGQTWITIMDKNLGATQVWNSGDTLSEANCGKYYQRGNNYGFPRTGSVTTSSTRVAASTYGPGNYYSSSTFITYNGAWDTTDNGNLWGGTSQGTYTGLSGNLIIGDNLYKIVKSATAPSGAGNNIITLVV